MIANILSAVVALVNALTDFLTPTAGAEGSLLNANGVAYIAALFALPVGAKVIRKAIGLIKSAGK